MSPKSVSEHLSLRSRTFGLKEKKMKTSEMLTFARIKSKPACLKDAIVYPELPGGRHRKSCVNFKVFLCNFYATSLALMIVAHHKKSADHLEMHCGCNGGFVP